MATLGFERASIATGRVNTRRVMDEILSLVRSRTDAFGRPLGEDPIVRDRTAHLYAEVLTHQASAQRLLDEMEDGRNPGPESSVWKLFGTKLVEELADFAVDLHGIEGQAALNGPADPWIRLAYQARGSSIAGGTTFIQRNIVAERVLGLPRASRPAG